MVFWKGSTRAWTAKRQSAYDDYCRHFGVAGILRQGREWGTFRACDPKYYELLVPTICLYEVFKRVSQQRGEEDALLAAGLILTGIVIDITQEVALFAA
jgi:hypothetical protein